MTPTGSGHAAQSDLGFFPLVPWIVRGVYFALSVVYSEGAIVLFVASSLLALRHWRWWVAGLYAARATAADPVGVAAIVPWVVAAVLAIRDRRERRALFAPTVAPFTAADPLAPSEGLT